MKKLIAVILALTLVLGLASCTGDGATELTTYIDAIRATEPSGFAVTTITQADAYGVELAGSVTVTYETNGTATVEYSIEKLSEANTGELIETLTGTVTQNPDGSYSGDIEGSVNAALSVSIDLSNAALIDSYHSANDILSMVVKAENTKAVLGVELPSEALAVIRLKDGRVEQTSLDYMGNLGRVSIICYYN